MHNTIPRHRPTTPSQRLYLRRVIRRCGYARGLGHPSDLVVPMPSPPYRETVDTSCEVVRRTVTEE